MKDLTFEEVIDLAELGEATGKVSILLIDGRVIVCKSNWSWAPGGEMTPPEVEREPPTYHLFDDREEARQFIFESYGYCRIDDEILNPVDNS